MAYSLEKARLAGEYKSVEYGNSDSGRLRNETSTIEDLVGYTILDTDEIIKGMKEREKKREALAK